MLRTELFLLQIWNRPRSEEHTSELQSQSNLVCRLLLEKKKNINILVPPTIKNFLHILYRSVNNSLLLNRELTRPSIIDLLEHVRVSCYQTLLVDSSDA